MRYSFQLTDEESRNLRSKILTSSLNNGYGGRRYNPRAFTEQGVYMLATILKGKKATNMTLYIMDAFITELLKRVDYCKCQHEMSQKCHY